MVNWQQKLAERQNEIASKFLNETKEWLDDTYSVLLNKMTQDFTNVYNQMLSTLGEKEKPSPAHLYRLYSYWDLHKNTRALFQSKGEEIYSHFNSQLKQMYIEIYEGIAPIGKEVACLVSEEEIQKLIDNPWGGKQQNVQDRIWINLTVLWDNLFGDLMKSVLKNSSVNTLTRNIEWHFEKSKESLNTIFSDENTHLRAYAAGQRYKDDFNSSEDKVDCFSSYISTYGNDEEIEACEVVSEAVATFSLTREADGDGDGEVDQKEYYEEEIRWEIIGSHGCEPCADLDGLIWNELYFGPVPVPVHPNCQCNITPAPLSVFADIAGNIADAGGGGTIGGMLASMLLIGAFVTLGVAVGDKYNSGCESPAEWLRKWGHKYPV